MRRSIEGLIGFIALAVLLVGCDNAVNDNRTANANTNANTTATSTPVVNTNANTTTRRAPTREEYERDRARYDREARESGRRVGSGTNDGWLWVKTRFELATADDLRDSTIDVDVENGVVTLSGTVASTTQKARAEQIVTPVEGVRSVKNQLRVTSDNANANRGNANR